jgi:probable phosphoglycerate mutase
VNGGSPARATSPIGGSPIPDGLDATLVLLRHGESEWIREGRFQGQAETQLSELGRRQAALAGERLAAPHAAPALPVPSGRPLEIIHSPLARTQATAQAVVDAIARTSLPGDREVIARPDPGILELAQGEWEGVTQDDIARRWPAELSAWRHRPWDSVAPGGEHLADVQARVRPALARALDRLGQDHPRGSFDRPQVAGYAGTAPDREQPWSILVGHDGVFKVVMLTLFDLPLTHFWMFSLGLTGISVVEIRGGRPVLRAHNLTGHLAPIEDEHAREIAQRRGRSGAL